METDEVGSAEWFSKEAWTRLRRIGMAGIQALAFGSSVLLHLGMAYGLKRIIPEDYHYLHKFLEAVVVLIFSGIYLAIALDTLVIYVPVLSFLKDAIDGKMRKNAEPVQTSLFKGTESPD